MFQLEINNDWGVFEFSEKQFDFFAKKHVEKK
jgi:hypothetical protein